jgi:hypothetical protein
MREVNPFDALDLDPCSSPEELTAELRRRVERVPEDERAELQRAWRTLTMKDDERVRLALLCHPRPPAGRDPLEALRRAVKPELSRRKAGELVPTVRDATVDHFDTTHEPTPPDPWSDS